MEGLWRWTARHPEWHPGEFGAEVACFAARAGDTTLLIDPLLPEDAGAAEDVLAVIDRGVIAREERYLEGKFGEEYLAYKRGVRRWV